MASTVLLMTGAVSAGALVWLALPSAQGQAAGLSSKDVVAPLVQRAAGWVRGLASRATVARALRVEAVDLVAAWVAARLSRRVHLPVRPSEALVTCVLADLVLALFATWWAASVAGGVVAIAGGFAWMVWKSGQLRRERVAQLAQEMPGLLRSMASSLMAGQSLPQAIAYAAQHERGPAAEPLARASMRLRCGTPVEETLALLSAELDAPGMRMLVSSLRIARRTGSPLGDLLEDAAELVERQGEFEQMLRVKTAQVRLSARIVCGLPCVLVAVLLLISPDFQHGVGTVGGMAALLVAAALDVAALLMIHRLMRGVL